MSKKIINQIKFLLEGFEKKEIKKLLEEIAEENKIKMSRKNEEVTEKELQLKIEKEVARQIGMYDITSEVTHEAYILIVKLLEELDVSLLVKQVVKKEIENGNKNV